MQKMATGIHKHRRFRATKLENKPTKIIFRLIWTIWDIKMMKNWTKSLENAMLSFPRNDGLISRVFFPRRIQCKSPGERHVMDLCCTITCLSCIEFNAGQACIEFNACHFMLCCKKFVKSADGQKQSMNGWNEGFCSFKLSNSNAVAVRMAREYWKMHAQASALVCILSNAGLGFASSCIGNALLGPRPSRAFSNTPSPSAQQYHITIR